MVDSLLSYYQEYAFNPVPIPLEDREAWQRHRQKRGNLYERHLGLPLAWLRGREVIEFGCNSGENALVLAHHGARLTLVEPNDQVLPRLRQLFANYGLERQIVRLVMTTVDGFQPTGKYDLVVAEGFINTIAERDRMLGKLVGLVAPGGRLVISFDDLHGSFMEVTRQYVLRRACEAAGVSDMHGAASLDWARRLFGGEFSRINASRPFEAWWKDALVNPFYAATVFWTLPQILAVLQDAGASVYAFSPPWMLPDAFAWYKNVASSSSRYTGVLEAWHRMLPFFMTGRPVGLSPASPGADQETLAALEACLDLFSTYARAGQEGATRPIWPEPVKRFLEETGEPMLGQFNREMEQLLTHLDQSEPDVVACWRQLELMPDLWGCPSPYLCCGREEFVTEKQPA